MDEKGVKVKSPFDMIKETITTVKGLAKVIVIDMHAEATSEKRAMAWFIDGEVTALVGTHTHVQTSDEEIMSGGMAYITDLGMTGPHMSVIGLDKDVAVKRFVTKEKKGYEVAKNGVRLEGVIIGVDESNGRANQIERIRVSIPQ